MVGFRFIVAFVLTFTSYAAIYAAEKTAEKAPLAFAFSHADAAKEKAEQLPYFRVFPDGKDKDGKNANGSLGTLKMARGESKLYKDEDKKPGLIVVFRRLVLVPLPSGDYKRSSKANSTRCRPC